MSHASRTPLTRGFTLIEVLVALVIVAFGVGAVLAALSSAAVNVSALREKTLAQWVALNRIADARLTLQAPQTGTSEGDVKNFANGDWHWRFNRRSHGDYQIVRPRHIYGCNCRR